MDNDATLQSVLIDYQEKFCHKKCLLEINYPKFDKIVVTFHEHDLHHLLGLHYVLDKSINATASIQRIKDNKLFLSDFTKSTNFRQMFSRFINYSFIERVFYDKKVKVCVLNKDLNSNNMRLDLVFYEEQGRTALVLGLRKVGNYYRLITLHESDIRKYKKVRKTKINNISWMK